MSHTQTHSLHPKTLDFDQGEKKRDNLNPTLQNTCKNARVPRWLWGIIATPGLVPLQTLAIVDGNDASSFPCFTSKSRQLCQEAQTVLHLHIASFSMRSKSANRIRQSKYDCNLLHYFPRKYWQQRKGT